MIRAELDTSALKKAFRAARRRAANFSQPFAEAGDLARAEFAAAFDASGPGWESNKKGTQTLVDTGALRASFTEQGAEGNVTEVGAREAAFGSDLPYAAVLQSGGVEVEDGIARTYPARPIAQDPTPEFEARLGHLVADHMRAAFEGKP